MSNEGAGEGAAGLGSCPGTKSFRALTSPGEGRAGDGRQRGDAVPCRAVTPARCHPALPVGAVPVQQEPVVKPRFHGASTATAPPSRSSEVSSLPASSIRPRQSWFLSWGRLDGAPEPAPCRPAVAPASCLLCPAPLVPAAHPATRTGSCGATPSHPTAAFVRHPAPRGQGHCCRTARGTGRLPRCWDWALRPFVLDLEPSPSSPSAAPAVPQFPLHQGMGGTLWVPAPGGLPPRLRPPSWCLPSPPLSPRRARGLPSGGASTELGPPPPGSLVVFSSPFFRSNPLKLSFPTRCHPMGTGGTRLRCSVTGCAAAKGFHLGAIVLSPASPKGTGQDPNWDPAPRAPRGACTGARLQTGRPCQELAGSAQTSSPRADGLPGGKRHGAEDVPRSGAVSPARIAFPLRSDFSCQAGSLRPGERQRHELFRA